MPFERLEDRAVKRVIKSKGKYLRIKGLRTLRLTVVFRDSFQTGYS